MQQSFFVNRSVTIVPREDKALPSIQVFFAELRRNFFTSPVRQEGTLFLSRVLVVVITTDNNEYFSSYNSIKEVKIPLLIGTFRFCTASKYRAQGIQNFRIQVPLSRPYQINRNPWQGIQNPELSQISLYGVIYFTMQPNMVNTCFTLLCFLLVSLFLVKIENEIKGLFPLFFIFLKLNLRNHLLILQIELINNAIMS